MKSFTKLFFTTFLLASCGPSVCECHDVFANGGDDEIRAKCQDAFGDVSKREMYEKCGDK